MCDRPNAEFWDWVWEKYNTSLVTPEQIDKDAREVLRRAERVGT